MRGYVTSLFATAALAAALSGCLELQVSRCEGIVCAPGLVCHAPLATCVQPEQLAACESKAENDDCAYAGTPAGNCLQGVCAPRGCGNGIKEIGEVCDDTNVMSGDGCSSDCKSNETCGNSIIDIEVGEACDDGNTDNDDSCRSTCVLPTCGDGVMDAGEICDDGNGTNGDGCNVKCTSNETCNNGVVDVSKNEDCDDSNTAVGDGCFECRFEVCGNGRIDVGEACDDNNILGNDGCSANCRSNETCGNGVIDVIRSEACDNGAANADTANADCRVNCQPRRCGDGIVDNLVGEQCEAGQLGAATCTSVFGYYGGTLTCSNTCGFSPASCVGRCGDGIAQSPQEECDQMNNVIDFVDDTLTCKDFGYYADPGLTCSPGCTVTSGGCTGGRCGDGTRDVQELCDPGNQSLPEDLGGNDCTDLGYYDTAGLECSLGCSFDSAQCTGGRCGDHIRNGPEFCDGTVPSTTCADFGLDMGRVGCTGFCGPGSSPDCSRRGFGSDPSPVSVTLRDVWSASTGELFAVGEGGTILRHDGLGWEKMTSNTTVELQSVWGTSPTNVYAVGGGSGAIVMHYNGVAWSQVTTPFVSATAVPTWYGVHGSGTTDVWVVGGGSPNATVLRFDGTTWTTQTSFGFGVSFQDVYVPSAGTAFVVGLATVRRFDSVSPNGAAVAISPAGNYSFNRIFGRSATDFYVSSFPFSSNSASIHRCDGSTCTIDGSFGSYGGVTSVFGNATEVYATVYGSASTSTAIDIYRREGLTWRSVDQPGARMWGGTLTSAGDVVTVGSSGSILRASLLSRSFTPGLGWTTADIYGVWAASETEAFIVGSVGKIHRRDITSGYGWTAMTSNTTQTLHGVWGASPTRVYAVGANGAIVMLDGAGPSWTVMTTNPATTQQFNAVWGTSATNVFAAGSGGIYHYDGNASNEWVAMSVPVGGGFVGIHGSGPNNVYAVGPGVIRHFNGTTWSSLSAPGIPPLNGVVVRSATDVIVVGAGGAIMQRVDYANLNAAWNYMTSPTGRDLTAITGQGPRGDVWAVGQTTDGPAEILHYDDERWTIVRNPFVGYYHDVAVVKNHVWVVGRTSPNFTPLGFELHHNVGAVELCGNEWDDNADGYSDCADPTCAGSAYCTNGGACEVVDTIACGTTELGDNFTGSPFPDDYRCAGARSETGPEVSYRFTAPASGSVTATLTNFPGGDLDLYVVEQHASGGCDANACVAAAATQTSSHQVTFTAVAGRTYQIVVEGFGGATSTFSLALSCP